MKIGYRLKQMREKRNLSQKQIAAELQMTQANYHKIESDKGEPKLSTLKKLADFYEIKVEDFFMTEKSVYNISNKNNKKNKSVGSAIITEEQSFDNERKLFEQLLESKNTIISQLQEESTFLKELIKKQQKTATNK